MGISSDSMLWINNRTCFYIAPMARTGSTFTVWDGFNWTMVRPVKQTENQELLKITFSHDWKIKCTPDHIFLILINNQEYIVEAQGLTTEHQLIPYTFPDGYISGAVQVKEIEWLKDKADVYSLDDGFSHTAVVGNILVGNNKGIYDS